jgi:hypothetical protein
MDYDMEELDSIGGMPPLTQAVLKAHLSLTPRVFSDVPSGWDQPVSELMLKIVELQQRAPEVGMSVKVAQFKEKFGGLRVYLEFLMNPGRTEYERLLIAEMDDDERRQYLRDHCPDSAEANAFIKSARELIDETANLVDTMCCVCGKPGELIRKGWHQVLCPECIAQQAES